MHPLEQDSCLGEKQQERVADVDYKSNLFKLKELVYQIGIVRTSIKEMEASG